MFLLRNWTRVRMHDIVGPIMMLTMWTWSLHHHHAWWVTVVVVVLLLLPVVLLELVRTVWRARMLHHHLMVAHHVLPVSLLHLLVLLVEELRRLHRAVPVVVLVVANGASVGRVHLSRRARWASRLVSWRPIRVEAHLVLVGRWQQVIADYWRGCWCGELLLGRPLEWERIGWPRMQVYLVGARVGRRELDLLV